VGLSIPDIFDGSQNAGENLAASGDFVAWLDDIPNPGDARLLSRHRHSERRLRDARVLKHQGQQRALIDLEHLVFITETAIQANLRYREFRDFELHIFFVDEIRRTERLT
jgi:hypothetical protein